MAVRRVRSIGSNIIGSFPSLKMKNRRIAFESTIERDLLFFLEYDSTVTCYYEQPFTIEATLASGKLATYTPDFQVIRTNGKELVECKPEALLKAPHTQHQTELGEQWAKENGHTFTLMTDLALRSGHRLGNLKLLWRYSRLPVSPSLEADCIDHIKRHLPSITLVDLVNTRVLAAHSSNLLPVLYHLLWKGLLLTDLTQPLNDGSLLWLPHSV
jgi:TnsA endonuclease N terminal